MAMPGSPARPRSIAPGSRAATGRPGILIGRHRGQVPVAARPALGDALRAHPQRQGRRRRDPEPAELARLSRRARHQGRELRHHGRLPRQDTGRRSTPSRPSTKTRCSHRWNPLTAVRSSPLHRVGDLLTIGQVFFPNDGGGTSSEAFFNDQARNLFLGLGLVLLETPDPAPHHRRDAAPVLGQGPVAEGSPERPDHAAPGRRGDPLSDECTDALQRLLSNSENTLSSVVATFNAPLTIFADAVVDAATSADDFRLRGRTRRRMSVYVRIPPNRLANARPLAEPVLLAAGQPEHPAPARAGPGAESAVPAGQRRVHGHGPRRRHQHGRRLPGRLQPAAADRGAGHVAAGCRLRRQGSPHLRHQPRPADPLRAARAARRRRVQRHARPLHRARHLTRAAAGPSAATDTAPSAATTASSAARCCCRRSSRNWGSERLVVIFENCKPILGEKIRYYLDKAFTSRACCRRRRCRA